MAISIRLTVQIGTSFLTLGLLRSEQVPALATAALEEGLDNPQLRQLAGFTHPDFTDLESITRALNDVEVRLPTRADAPRVLARAISSSMIQGDVDPFEGAFELSKISWKVGNGFHELDPFVHASSEAKDRPADREFFRKAILDEAARWVSAGRGSV